MAYIDKTFYFDSLDREIPIAHPVDYGVSWWDHLTLRKRSPEFGSEEELISIELWQSNPPLYGEKVEDAEVCLTRDGAMLLANKLIRAVNELDTESASLRGLDDKIRYIEDFLNDEGDDYEHLDEFIYEREGNLEKFRTKRREERVLRTFGDNKVQYFVDIVELDNKVAVDISSGALDGFFECGATEEEAIAKINESLRNMWKAIKAKESYGGKLTYGMSKVKNELEKLFGDVKKGD